jgi:hypothetical protein
VASEAYFHLAGGFESGLKPKRVKLRHAVDKLPAGTSYWWLIEAQRIAELEEIIAEEGLNPDETRQFIADAFRDGAVAATGTAVTKILPPVTRFSPEGGHGEKKQRVLVKLSNFFERFFGLSAHSDGE